MSNDRPDWLLFCWLICDVVWSLALIYGAGYVVFILHRSTWWIALAFFISYCLGGTKLYKAPGERFGIVDIK